MKKSVYLNVFLIVAVVVLAYKLISDRLDSSEHKSEMNNKTELTMENNSTISTIHARKSVRHYTGKEVSKSDIETLLKAGMASPSAVNKQPWAFFVVTDTAKLSELAANLPYAKMTKDASAAIVVCGDLNKAMTGVNQNYWIVDCAMASQNILLAAESMGLGAVFTAVWPYKDRTDPVVRILNLPDNFKPLNVIPIGYPTGVDKAKDKWKPENVYFNSYVAK